MLDIKSVFIAVLKQIHELLFWKRIEAETIRACVCVRACARVCVGDKRL